MSILTTDTVAYVGKETCKQCHYEIYESYMQTAMGQSFGATLRIQVLILQNW